MSDIGIEGEGGGQSTFEACLLRFGVRGLLSQEGRGYSPRSFASLGLVVTRHSVVTPRMTMCDTAGSSVA